jgi:hypothetical protein
VAFCPNCSHRAPLTTILRLDPGETYHCAWCDTTSLLDPKRFHFAASTTAVFFLLFPLAAYLIVRNLGGILASIALWGLVSPFAYAEWVSLRLREHASGQLNAARREPRREAARPEEKAV